MQLDPILNALQKLAYLRSLGVDAWDLSVLNPNRRKLLAYLGRQSSNQALQRSAPERRYPILMAFLKQTMEDVIDEVIELFDRCLWDCNSRAKEVWYSFLSDSCSDSVKKNVSSIHDS